MLLDRVAQLTGILTQPLNPMDITDGNVIEIVPDSLKSSYTSFVEAVEKTTGNFYLFHKTL